MGVFPPAALPVLSGLAAGFAVCDHWYSTVPTETFPNRAFACAATSQGHMDDGTASFTVPTIFGLMTKHNMSWKISAPLLATQQTPADYDHYIATRTATWEAARTRGNAPAG